ncbi:MAG: phosphoribosyltransferase domain-containing protein [Rhodobacteraceae bacterium]|nr:phosphoribosyltransferase domain-containing protein [Paracoccaceae bacterium]
MTHILIDSDWTEHRLTTGSLHLKSATGATGQSTDFFRLAERINPKRAFLFVSTVLGRHIPVAPNVHRAALQRLAAKVSDQLLDGPVFVMGYAETAVGLGAGVFQELRRTYPGRAMGYQATTRFEPSARDVWFRIEEPHSHASSHAILKPKIGVLHQGPGSTLVLVDDETTTGTTFCNLAARLYETGVRFDRVVLATLTDWSEGSAADGVSGAIPGAEVAAVSLFDGAWRWEQDTTQDRLPQLPGSIEAECPAWRPTGEAPLEAARFGIAGAAADTMNAELAAQLFSEVGLDALPCDARILVLGSGEHVWDPFLFAETIAESRPETRFAATTRSPILLGEAIEKKIAFGDHYGLGVALLDALGTFVVVDQNANVVRFGGIKAEVAA